MQGFYEEKVFDGEVYFRTSPIGAFAKKPGPKLIPAKYPIDKLLNVAQIRLNQMSRNATLQMLGTYASTITRIRKGEERISPELVLRFHDATGLSIAEIRNVCNIPKLINAPLSGALTDNKILEELK